MTNKELVEEFPFLLPKNRLTGEVPENYDYSYTELDAMPEGWRKAFGIQLCKELKEALGENLHNYRIMQIKEKYGDLCWYDCGGNDETFKILDKYQTISANTCIKCGQPGELDFDGWILTLCKKHYEERHKHNV